MCSDSCAARASKITDCLTRLRRHIYVFKNRDAWRDALNRQIESIEISSVELKLDMPVRWSFMHRMLVAVLHLRDLIAATMLRRHWIGVCAISSLHEMSVIS